MISFMKLYSKGLSICCTAVDSPFHFIYFLLSSPFLFSSPPPPLCLLLLSLLPSPSSSSSPLLPSSLSPSSPPLLPLSILSSPPLLSLSSPPPSLRPLLPSPPLLSLSSSSPPLLPSSLTGFNVCMRMKRAAVTLGGTAVPVSRRRRKSFSKKHIQGKIDTNQWLSEVCLGWGEEVGKGVDK